MADVLHGAAAVGLIATDVMITSPKVLPAGARIADAAAQLDDDHVHLVLLVDGRSLRGTIDRDDLRGHDPAAPALAAARLAGRTVAPGRTAESLRSGLIAAGRRRVAVVSTAGELLGLVCLRRDLTGFCTDAGVAARAAERTDR